MKNVRLSIAEAFSKCPTTIDTEHAWTLWQLTLTGRNLKLRFFPRLCLICGRLFNNYLFLDSGVETVIKRSHVLERKQLDVEPYYPFLENSSTNKTDIAFEAEVYDYVKKYHQRELQEQKVLVEFSDDVQSSTITIFPSEKKVRKNLFSRGRKGWVAWKHFKQFRENRSPHWSWTFWWNGSTLEEAK